jgi:DNA-binding transcriptional MerR regulator
MSVENLETYTIGQVCDILGCEHHNLRYIEKTIGLEIKRDQYTDRSYTEQDLNVLKMVFQLRKQGMNYKAIKMVLEQQEEIVADVVEDVRNDVIIQDQNLNNFISMMTNVIEKTIETQVNSKLEALSDDMKDLKLQNEELRGSIEQLQEKHFKELDDRLSKWREEQKEKENKSFFKRLLNK